MKKQVLSILGVGVLALGATGQAEATPIITDGLVAAYEFEGNAVDSSSGGAHTGSEYGGVSYVQGIRGQAASFDGVDDYIDLNTTNFSGSLGVNESFSVSMWLSGMSNLVENDNRRIFSNYISESSVLGVDLPQDRNFYDVFARGPIYGNGNTQRSSAIPTDPLDWDMLTLTYENNSFDVYLNGVYASEFNYTLGEFINSGTFKLFHSTGWAGDYSAGIIDELYVYDHALTSSDVQVLYNDAAPVPEPATMLLFGTGLAGLVGMSRKKKKK